MERDVSGYCFVDMES